MTASPTLASLVQCFFTDRLIRQQRASPHTVASYRDTFRLLLRFAQDRLGKAPATLALDDLARPHHLQTLDLHRHRPRA